MPSASRFFLATATILVAVSLNGCSGLLSLIPTLSPNTIPVTGNWQVASSSTTATHLSAISGELTGNSGAMKGIFHADSATACVSPSTSFDIAGSANAQNVVTLSGAVAGGTLTLSGTLATDGKSLTNATYNVTGGSCAFTAPVTAMAQSYASIAGNYTGSFSDPGGNVINITAQLSQTPASDTDGNFQLSGTGTFPSNPCFNSPVTIANSQVTGGSFTLTYTDSVTTNSVTASGTFSTDGTTLTVTNWTLSGPCGPDSGAGLLTKQ